MAPAAAAAAAALPEAPPPASATLATPPHVPAGRPDRPVPAHLRELDASQLVAATAPARGVHAVRAGPGSGKTRVLCARAAHLVLDLGHEPSHILAITFTNKAARELRERLAEMRAAARGEAPALEGSGAGGAGEREAAAGAGRRRGGEVWATTFHGWCLSFLRGEPGALEALGLGRSARVLGAEEARQALRRALVVTDPEPRGAARTRLLSEASSAIGRARAALPVVVGGDLGGLHSREDAHAFYLRGGRPGGASVPAQLVRRQTERLSAYLEELRALSALDFDSLVSAAEAALASDPSRAARARRRHTHVLVDEFQDTSPALWRVLALLCPPADLEGGAHGRGGAAAADPGDREWEVERGIGEGRVERTGGAEVATPTPGTAAPPPSRSLFVVGDNRQGIYGFRGAVPARLERDLRAAYRGLTETRLSTNYRSVPEIVWASEEIAHCAARTGGADPGSARTSEGPRVHRRAIPGAGGVLVTSYKTPEAEAAGVAEGVARLWRSEAPGTSIAVLARVASRLRPIEKELVRRRVPYVLVGGKALGERREVLDAAALVRLAADPSDASALHRAINVPKRGLGDRATARLKEATERAGMSLNQLLLGGVVDLVDTWAARAPPTAAGEAGEASEASAGLLGSGGRRDRGPPGSLTGSDEGTLADHAAVLTTARLEELALPARVVKSAAGLASLVTANRLLLLSLPLPTAVRTILEGTGYLSHLLKEAESEASREQGGGEAGEEGGDPGDEARPPTLIDTPSSGPSEPLDLDALSAAVSPLARSSPAWATLHDRLGRLSELLELAASAEETGAGAGLPDGGEGDGAVEGARGPQSDVRGAARGVDPAERLRIASSFLDSLALCGPADNARDAAAGASPGAPGPSASLATPGLPSVRLSTIHAAKGLEFEHVFVAACQRDLRDADAEDELDGAADRPDVGPDEETRVAFVAASRAKGSLTMSYAWKGPGWGRSGGGPSREVRAVERMLAGRGGGAAARGGPPPPDARAARPQPPPGANAGRSQAPPTSWPGTPGWVPRRRRR